MKKRGNIEALTHLSASSVGDLRDDTIPDDTVQHIDTLCWQDEASGVLQGHCVRLKNLR